MYIQRDLEPVIKKNLSGPEYIAVIGARQAGKTTLLRHIQENIKDSAFLTFEDVEIRDLFDTDIKSFINLFIEPHSVIFIDEFQYAKNGGMSLKFVYDTVPGKKILVSGSSALDLTISAVKHMVGRLFCFTLYPLSFREFLGHKDPELFRILVTSAGKRHLEHPLLKRFHRHLDEYVVFGGYPRIALARDDEERRTILKNIFNIYLLRDVRDVLGLIDDYKMLNLAKALALQVGNIVSFQELCMLVQESLPAVKKHLNLLEKTFILRLVKPYFTNKRTELVKNPKVYFLDSGLRNSIIDDFRSLGGRSDRGALLENFHFSEFMKMEREVKYWRTRSKAEVDFIVDEKIPVEVKSSLSRPVPGKSLYSFIEKYDPAEAIVLNNDIYKQMKIGKTPVRFIYHFSDYFSARRK
ncbi:MAG: ATP-binding protein [Acidobacteria bacterium]|nr:ATP-binding protein [Acidobacteriota bacterium]MCG2816089.1 ATP-binding protein [Candidatus Aminicenantes bacterium]MBU1338028.1 ATP-binding protein [Acidobacteriota bacterium]MBU1475489.1 ATP-binding protein [Acidobacteriota bacterium]MBU2438013.1 ATP-binding protein [Acidobacteriota bacterium]